MRDMHKFQMFLVLLLASFCGSSTAGAIGLSSNWGIGYGHSSQDYGATSFDPQSIAGHVDIQLNLWKIVLGGSYLTVTNYNAGDERNYVGMGAVHVGFNLSNSVQLIGGVGAGKWRRRREDEVSVPHDYDYHATGTGPMYGVRVFLINTKQVSVGFSGTYYQMKSDSYESTLDGVKAEVEKSSKGMGSIVALVVRLSLDDVKNIGNFKK